MSNKTKQYKLSRKEILLYFAPDDLKDFIEELSKIETKKDYNNIRNKNKDIFDKFPEFTKNWKYNKEDGKPGTKKYNYKLILNETTQVQNQTKIHNIIKRFKDDDNLKVDTINTELSAYYNSKQEEAKQREAKIKEQTDKEKEEEIRAEAEQRNKEEIQRKEEQHEKDKQKQQAEHYKNKEETTAKYKNENEELKEEIKQLKEEAKNNNNINNGRLKYYIRDKYIIDSPLKRDELFEKVAKDPNLNANTEKRINKYVDYILGQQLHRLITSKTKIIKTAKLFGNDADYLSKLDPSVREAVLKYQTDMINKTITDKNNKYLLPKKFIKFEKAINNYKVNPLILRGLYVK